MKISLWNGQLVDGPDYWWVLRKMTPAQRERAWLWDRITFRSWEGVREAVRIVAEVVDLGLLCDTPVTYLHLWRGRGITDTSGNERVQPIGGETAETEIRVLMLRSDSSLWPIVHEFAHLLDVPQSTRRLKQNGKRVDHGGTFIAYLTALADAVETHAMERLLGIADERAVRLYRVLAAGREATIEATELIESLRAETDPSQHSADDD